MVNGVVPQLATQMLKHLNQHANAHAKTDLKCIDNFIKVILIEQVSEPRRVFSLNPRAEDEKLLGGLQKLFHVLFVFLGLI